jgi:hypothetical protein
MWEVNIKMDLKEAWYEVVDWIELAQDPVECFYSHGNGASGSVEGGKCLYWLGNSDSLKNPVLHVVN